MPGKYSVLNQPNFQEELKRLNKRIINKKHRLKKNYGVKLEMDTRSMSDFKTKKDFDRFKKDVLKVADRKADIPVKNARGTTLDLDQVKQTKKILDKANKAKKERLEYYMKQPSMDRGKDTGFTLAQTEYGMKTEKFGSLQPTVWNPDRFNTPKELAQFLAQKQKAYEGDFLSKRDHQYLNNYIDSLNKAFGSDAQDIIEALKGMPVKDFIDKYYKENLVNIEFIYSRRDAITKMNVIRKQFNM